MNYKIIIIILSFSIFFVACKNDKKENHEGHAGHGKTEEVYTCTMHPDVIRNQPGNCPICGMKLVKKESGANHADEGVQLESQLKPTNGFVVSSVPVMTIERSSQPVDIEALGTIAYDTRQIGSISARFAGRIEKLYVRSLYQPVRKGQRVMDIYSPEILTAEQDLLLLLRRDPTNKIMIEASKRKLMLLGMSTQQLGEVISKHKPDFTIAVYSNYNGFIKNAELMKDSEVKASMGASSQTTGELSIKEGMYVQKGQTVFNVYDPSKTWALLNVYIKDKSLLKKGQSVNLISETIPDKIIKGKIDFIEPFYRAETRTITARIYFNNSVYKIPVGSQVRATISGGMQLADWLPKSSVISLGLDKVAFLKSNDGFVAHKINTGIEADGKIQVLGGLSATDSVAVDAEYLMDSESFIKTNN
ncbi:efflux RND transporter periplasmic adaptor subunit [Epilithonimonas pallida]|uniref:Membrane fusion protein, Cu(I)/Ag(I) efflux system n=1 Tax=Epilithonimonas pallida TaxID=373671 RepID=A0ABY1R1K7_9FLAO|nr:efflux RND transporter periplasmic adaptor subunit [Epilithonimonas pallida]SMP88285.1 membrane fusion protein, Cu(I)/Ag(I) efflux system [Epilithonimonas pallida]